MSNTQTKDLNDLRLSLEGLTLQELRVKAKKVFDISVTREHTAEDITALIMSAAGKHDFAVESAGDLKPGWSRIRVHPVPGRSNAPFYLNINGRSFGVLVNIDCDVPNKVVGVLRDAQEAQPVLSENLEVTGFALQASYPFTLIETKPGPDPRPGMEVQREAKLKSKREFEAREGFWPRDAHIAQQRQIAFLRN